MAEYRVVRDGIPLGTLVATDQEMFWSEGEFRPTAAFEAVRPLFDRERTLLEADEIDAWAAAWDELAAGLVLVPLDGREPITEFLLHIDGDRASWRY